MACQHWIATCLIQMYLNVPIHSGSAALSMDASESYDPDDAGDQPSVMMEFVWFCQKQRQNVDIVTAENLMFEEHFNGMSIDRDILIPGF